jgi:arylsulfatase A-like enzyme
MFMMPAEPTSMPRCVSFLTAIIITFLIAGASAAEDSPPNIVLILADDLGSHDVGFNGRKEWSTPNLDRLAGQGTIFKRFYTAAVVCAPSRAALLTGKSTIHCGVSRNNEDLPAREVTIAEALKARGYATALFGKWHHGAPRVKGQPYVHPMDQGFDEFFGFTDATHAWEKYPKTLWSGRDRKPSTGYADDLFADHAIDFLKRHKSGGPFFLYLPFTNAHFNIEAPPEEVSLHRGQFTESDPAKPLNATYAAMITRLDKNVGRVAATLQELGLSRNTLIVFTSDHGATFESGNQGTSSYHDSNAPFRGQKRTLWEGGVRVPAFATWPGHVPGGAESQEIMSTLDLMPTFLAAAGTAPEAAWHVDGINLVPAWTSKTQLPPRTLFWEWRSEGGNQLAALRGNDKLVITHGGAGELFDVAADPAERRNIASQAPEIYRELGEQLKAWMETEVHQP